MAASGSERELDVVLFGATGFTGGLTADYLARHAPPGLRWGLAGRNPDKLAAVRERVAGLRDGADELPLLVADAADPDSLAEVARRTAVVATTVGPYLEYGEPLVAACAAAGTDYADLTGEPEFVDRMYVAHHATAERTGARLVHACGFDSVPHDLGALFTVAQLPDDVPITMRGVVRAGGRPSGGTFQTALTAMSRMRQARAASSARRKVEPRPEGRSSRAVPGTPHRDAELGLWLLPLPLLDPLVVARSGRALPAYGPDFRYTHYAGFASLPWAAGAAVGAGALGLAAQVGPVRDLVGRQLQAGEGPDEERRSRSWFSVDFVAEADGGAVHTRVTGGDPGYGETAMMLGESAMCLALDDNPEVAGQVTTAVAMGESLTARLVAGGLGFEVVD
ncbi:trans-acting enoyl reductase family protein [Nocardioides sp.]|uniref:saccharopine dehydrogenase family protein n=1 Tax=Nocardioides sp. TaxID=35761 RepID=UPI003527079E